jgi:flagellar protein FlgJ
MIEVNPASLAIDPKALGELKRRAAQDPEGSLKAVARQFEALLLDQMMRSLRTAAPGESLFENEATRMFTGVLDQEYSRQLAARGGIGLADMLVKQLTQLRSHHGQEDSNLADNQPTGRSPA